MQQRALDSEKQTSAKVSYPGYFKNQLTTFTGLPYDFAPMRTAEETPASREAFWEERWNLGGFRFFGRPHLCFVCYESGYMVKF